MTYSSKEKLYKRIKLLVMDNVLPKQGLAIVSFVLSVFLLVRAAHCLACYGR